MSSLNTVKTKKMSFNQICFQNYFPKLCHLNFPSNISGNDFLSTQKCQLRVPQKIINPNNWKKLREWTRQSYKEKRGRKTSEGWPFFGQNFPLGLPQRLWGKKRLLDQKFPQNSRVVLWLSPLSCSKVVFSFLGSLCLIVWYSKKILVGKQEELKEPTTPSPPQKCVCIYIYAVESKVCPRFGLFWVKHLAKVETKSVQYLFCLSSPNFIVLFGYLKNYK